MITKICVNCDIEKRIDAFMKPSRAEVILDKCWTCNLRIIKQGELWSKTHADSVFRLRNVQRNQHQKSGSI